MSIKMKNQEKGSQARWWFVYDSS